MKRVKLAKRIAAALLAAVLVLNTVPTVLASPWHSWDAKIGDWSFRIGQGGLVMVSNITLWEYSGNEPIIFVPNLFSRWKLGHVGYSISAAFTNNQSVTSVTISKDVTSINGNAFTGCTNLEKLIFASPTPPSIGAPINWNKDLTVFVPFGAKTAYEANRTLNMFSIVELPEGYNFRKLCETCGSDEECLELRHCLVCANCDCFLDDWSATCEGCTQSTCYYCVNGYSYMWFGLKTMPNVKPLYHYYEDFRTSLTSYDLSHRRITDSELKQAAYMSRVQNLDLSNNRITDITPLSTLKSLQTLDLSNNRITDIAPLSSLTNLQVLDLSNNQIADLTPLCSLWSLQALDLRNNPISDITPLLELAGFRNLYLSSASLTAEQKEELHLRWGQQFWWRKIIYDYTVEIAFNTNDGNRATYAMTNEHGRLESIPAPKRDGWIFSHWSWRQRTNNSVNIVVVDLDTVFEQMSLLTNIASVDAVWIEAPHRIDCEDCDNCARSPHAGKHGHVLGNENATVNDALEILKYIVGLGNIIATCDNSRKAATIVDNAVGVQDALEILKKVVGLPNLIDNAA